MSHTCTSSVPLWWDENRECVLSTVVESAIDDKFATTWQSVTPVAFVPSLASPATFPFTFGRYELLGLLGEGEMGSVFLARDTKLRRQVAMKIPKTGQTPDATIRLEREAYALAKVRHANVCPVYDFGDFGGTHFLTMAYIEGETLAQHLVPDSPQSCRHAGSQARARSRRST